MTFYKQNMREPDEDDEEKLHRECLMIGIAGVFMGALFFGGKGCNYSRADEAGYVGRANIQRVYDSEMGIDLKAEMTRKIQEK